MRLFLSVLIALFVLSSPVWAADEPALPAPLEKQKAAGAQIFYLGKSQDMDGWVMVRGGQPEFYYVSPTGAIVLGILFDAQGNMVTPNQMIALQQSRKQELLDMVQPQTAGPVPDPAAAAPAIPAAPTTIVPGSTPDHPAVAIATAPTAGQPDLTSARPQNSPSEKLLAAMQASPAVTWGNPSAPAFYAFIDPNCVHCQQFLREVEPFVTSGRVSVHLVLVAFDEASARQAAFLMASADGADRMIRYAKGDKTSVPITEADTSAVTRNTETMNGWNLRGTPHILYRGPDEKIRLVRGRPFDITATVNDLAPAR